MFLKEFSKATHPHTHSRSLLLCCTHRQVRWVHYSERESCHRACRHQESNGVSSLKKKLKYKNKPHASGSALNLCLLEKKSLLSLFCFNDSIGMQPGYGMGVRRWHPWHSTDITVAQWVNTHACVHVQELEQSSMELRSSSLQPCACWWQKRRLAYPSRPIQAAGAQSSSFTPHAHLQQHVVLNMNQTTRQGEQREGGDGVKERREAEACIPS